MKRVYYLELAGIMTGMLFWGTTSFGARSDDKTPPPAARSATLMERDRPVVEPTQDQKNAAGTMLNANIQWNLETGVPESVRAEALASYRVGGKGLPLKAGTAYAENAIAVMDRLSTLYRIQNAPSEFTVYQIDGDTLGYHHARLHQQYQGLRVMGGELIVHFDAKDSAYQVNGRYVPGIDIAIEPSLTATNAVKAAQTDLATRSKLESTVAQGPELMVYAWKTVPTLAYELTLSSGPADVWRYWVDAGTGGIINGYNDVAKGWNDRIEVDISGNLLPGEGAVPCIVKGMSLDLGLEEPDIYYYLYSTNPPWANWYIYNAAYFGYEDNESCARRMISAWGSSDSTEFSAAYNFNIVMRYYHDVHGRNSFDNIGPFLRS